MVSYDDKNYRVQVSEEYNNPYITTLWHGGYILKVLNSLDSPKFHVGKKKKWNYKINCISFQV